MQALFDLAMELRRRRAITRCAQGLLMEALAAHAEAEHIDLLVMGAYGHSRIGNFIIGSTTSEMIRSVKLPVMLFR